MKSLASVIALLCITKPACAQTVDEDTVKSAFLWRFASFVVWPQTANPSPANPIRLCVVGSRGFADRVEAVGEAEHQADIRLIKLERADLSAGCHIAFIGVVDGEEIGDSLRAFRDSAVLTVTDEVNGPERGVIHFQVVEHRVRFHIDLQQARTRSLVLNSRLLGVALTVTQPTGSKP